MPTSAIVLIMDEWSYPSEEKLDPDQHSPLGRLMDSDELSRDGDDQLAGGQENLIGSDEHPSNLEWCQFGDIGDQNGLGEPNT